jgi:hypothetical protein
LRDGRCADVAASAGAILDNDRLSPLCLQLVADDSGEHIVRAAARIGNEKLHRLARKCALSQRQVAAHRHGPREDQADTTGRSKASEHDFLPDFQRRSIGERRAETIPLATL